MEKHIRSTELDQIGELAWKNENLTCVNINTAHATCVFFWERRFYLCKYFFHIIRHVCIFFHRYLFYNISPIYRPYSDTIYSTWFSVLRPSPGCLLWLFILSVHGAVEQNFWIESNCLEIPFSWQVELFFTKDGHQTIVEYTWPALAPLHLHKHCGPKFNILKKRVTGLLTILPMHLTVQLYSEIMYL